MEIIVSNLPNYELKLAADFPIQKLSRHSQLSRNFLVPPFFILSPGVGLMHLGQG